MAVVVLAIVGALVWAFWPEPVPVDAEEVLRGPLRVTVDEEGITRVRERYVVSAPLGGRLERIELEAGDSVIAETTTLAVIAPTAPELLDVRALAEAEARVRAAQAAVQRAEAMVQRAQATLQFAQTDFQRVREAYERDAATPRDLDTADVALRQAEQEMRSAEFGREVATFELDQAQAALLHVQPDGTGDAQRPFEIISPITGRVLRVMQESATIVQPGAPLLELGDPADLEIVIDVLSTDAVRVQPGARVIIERWGGDNPLPGVVRLVEPSGFTEISALGVEEQRVNVIVDITAPQEQWRSLGDQYRVEGSIVLWEEPDVLTVPTSALFRVGGAWAVFVIDNGRAALRQVSIGRQGGFRAQVLDGLRAGERVIVHPSDRVQEGVRVTVR